MQHLSRTLSPLLLLGCIVGATACTPAPDPSAPGDSPSDSSATSEGSDAPLPGDGITVRSANSNWIEEQFVTEVVNIGLSELGYEIEPIKQADYAAINLAVANGDLDYTTGFYTRGHDAFFENAGGEEKLEKVGILVSDGGQQALMVDQATAEEYQLDSITQLQDPAIAQLFDTDGDGKANIAGCQVGWRCNQVIEDFIEVYELEDTVEQDQGVYVALLADVLTRYDQGDPILFYAYSPHWVLTRLEPEEDIVPLTVPFSLPGDDPEDTSIDGQNLGFLVAPQALLANQTFVDSHPVAKQWFEAVEVPAAALNAASLRIQEGENSADDIRRQAEEWVANNREVFDQWLAQAKAAG